jgi:hypothetical protein
MVHRPATAEEHRSNPNAEFLLMLGCVRRPFRRDLTGATASGAAREAGRNGYNLYVRSIELLRHTANDGDKLTPEGIAAAEAIGRERLTPPYALFGSTGASRATEMVEILRRVVGQEDVPVTEVRGLRSSVEDRWRAAAKAAGKGADVEAIRAIDPDLVEKESMLLGAALRGVFDALPEGGRGLVVGHSPTNEAAVLGLAGTAVSPLDKGEGVLVVEDGGRFQVGPM